LSTSGYYDQAAASYASIRRAVAIDQVVGAIAAHGRRALRDSDLIDAGCGSGLYISALAPLVGSLIAFDVSPGMLERAAAVRGALPQDVKMRVEVLEADITHMPFENGSADVVLVSLVLHHVFRVARSREAVSRALKECRRVLRERGVLITITCTPAQVLDAAWYCALLPSRILDQSIERHGTVVQQVNEAEEVGFKLLSRVVPVDEILHGEAYFDKKGPLDSEWRAADSIFSLATEDEIAEIEATLRSRIEDGSLDQWFEEREERRRSVGQVTVSVYRRR
jgi:ubiquinone/menaquinone biosynthesis C-methylase UbiE